MARSILKALAALAVLAVSGLEWAAQAQAWPFSSDANGSREVPQSRAEVQLSYAPLVKRAAPAVVNVFTEKVVAQPISPFATDPQFRDFFGTGPTRPRVQGSLGSGVIIQADGVIVTNAHVVKDADSLRVVLSDRREFPAEIILTDERTDLAVLRIDTKGERLPTLDFADTRSLEVGDLVLAIGNPFGVGQTVTSGIVSATARTDVGISDYAFFIQTDAAINPGNSGGALVGMDGRLIGVNTAIYSRSGGSNGIGFSIPAEMVKRVVDAAVNEGRIVRPWLGLKGQSVNSDMVVSLGLKRPQGVVVTEVYPDGPAALAGLRSGDLVLTLDGREVYDERGLKFIAATRSVGETVNVELVRAGRRETRGVRLASPPGTAEAELVLLDDTTPFAGADVAELSPALAEELGGDPFLKGLLVTRIMRGAYARRFLRPGDVIVSLNGREIDRLSDFEAGAKLTRNNGWRVAVLRNGRRIEGTIPM